MLLFKAMNVVLNNYRGDENRVELPSSNPGWLNFGKLGLPVLCSVDVPDSWGTMVSKENPAYFRIAGDGLSIMIWIHESVPKDFREVVLYHELVEAELCFAYDIEIDAAHRTARSLEFSYAKEHLKARQLERYKSWRSSVKDESS